MGELMKRFGLTTREEQVALALVETAGCNKTLARRLGIAAETVKDHIRHICEKMGAHGRLGAALQAQAVALGAA